MRPHLHRKIRKKLGKRKLILFRGYQRFGIVEYGPNLWEKVKIICDLKL